MRKNFLRILCGTLCACVLALSLVACGGAGWKASSLNNPGETDNANYARAGFVAETENYIYYLNGVASTTDNNAFGAPVKGALMAVDKTDLSSTTEVVVPKLFTSKNYQQGLFICGDYVYYGTPSTNKTSSGSIATTDMVFTRSSLDGKATTEALYTVDSHSTDYRFIESEGVVYIIYYDVNEAELVSVNTSTKEVKSVIKTDAEISVDVPVNEEYGESLNAYKFVGDKLFYTVTVYNAPYNKDMEADGGTRGTASYNKVYTYDVAKGAEVVFDGRESGTTYEIKYVNQKINKIYVSETRNTLTKTYSYDLGTTLVKGIEVNADYLADANVFVGDNVYSLSEGKIYFDSIAKNSINKEVVAKCDTISTLLFVDEYLYYLNSENKICKIELENEDAHEIVITENSVLTSWYAPAIITLNEKDYLFYADSSAYGLDYVKYVELDDDKIVAEDTDEDGEKDKWAYAEGSSQFLGKILVEDAAKIFEAKANALLDELNGGAIVFETDKDDKYVVEEGSLVWKSLAEIRAEYDGLDKNVKAKVGANIVEMIEKFEKALEMASVYNKLDGVREYKNAGAEDETEGARLQAIYNQVKTTLTNFENSSEFEDLKGYIDNNFKHLFQTAKELFEVEE